MRFLLSLFLIFASTSAHAESIRLKAFLGYYDCDELTQDCERIRTPDYGVLEGTLEYSPQSDYWHTGWALENQSSFRNFEARIGVIKFAPDHYYLIVHSGEEVVGSITMRSFSQLGNVQFIGDSRRSGGRVFFPVVWVAPAD